MAKNCLRLVQPVALAEHIKFDHGYTAKSPAIVNVCFFAMVIDIFLETLIQI